MVSRFWVGGGSSANWTATGSTNWAATSGGANNQTVPTVSEDVFLDGSSGSGTVILDANSSVKSFVCTGFVGTFDMGSSVLTVGSNTNTNGDLTLSSGMTLTFTPASTARFNTGTSSGAHAVTTAGKTLPRLNVGIGVTCTLKDNFTSSQDISNAGTLDAADSGGNHNVTADVIDTSGADALTMGNGTWTMTGAGKTNKFNAIVVTPGSSTIKFTGDGCTFQGGGKTYNNFWNSPGSSTSGLTITGANTFNDFKDDGTGAHTITFPASTTQTVTSFTVSTAGGTISLISSSAGTAATLSKSTGTVNSFGLSIKDSAATGGATWNDTNGVNVSGNTGWNFLTTAAPLGMLLVF